MALWSKHHLNGFSQIEHIHPSLFNLSSSADLEFVEGVIWIFNARAFDLSDSMK